MTSADRTPVAEMPLTGLAARGKRHPWPFPLGRPQETPRASWVDGHRILLGQTFSRVCYTPVRVQVPTESAFGFWRSGW